MSDNAMRLENWYLVPELNRVFGNVYNNPNFEDGDRVRTSPVVSIEGDILKTQNSTYKLGKADSYTSDGMS